MQHAKFSRLRQWIGRSKDKLAISGWFHKKNHGRIAKVAIGRSNIAFIGEHIMATIRYLVGDVDRSIAFYTRHLGFALDQRMAPAFARVSRDGLTLWLAGPAS